MKTFDDYWEKLKEEQLSPKDDPTPYVRRFALEKDFRVRFWFKNRRAMRIDFSSGNCWANVKQEYSTWREKENIFFENVQAEFMLNYDSPSFRKMTANGSGTDNLFINLKLFEVRELDIQTEYLKPVALFLILDNKRALGALPSRMNGGYEYNKFKELSYETNI